ncbi:MAG TPA: hypothetical protein VFM94_11455, partial [Solirubrobacterales bacterium]|nr:hypothetical protein [Solirubrobacterales bacterium]
MRISTLSNTPEVDDPTYRDGLHSAVLTAIDYGFAIIEAEDETRPPIPQFLCLQARRAAHNGVGLDTVVRRYIAGYTLLSDFVMQEATASRLEESTFREVTRTTALLFERLVGTVTEEHMLETTIRARSTDQRKTARIRSLLQGELVDTKGLDYDFDAHHLG